MNHPAGAPLPARSNHPVFKVAMVFLALGSTLSLPIGVVLLLYVRNGFGFSIDPSREPTSGVIVLDKPGVVRKSGSAYGYLSACSESLGAFKAAPDFVLRTASPRNLQIRVDRDRSIALAIAGPDRTVTKCITSIGKGKSVLFEGAIDRGDTLLWIGTLHSPDGDNDSEDVSFSLELVTTP